MNDLVLSMRRHVSNRLPVTRSLPATDHGRAIVLKGTSQQSIVLASLQPASSTFSCSLWFWMSANVSNQRVISYRSTTIGQYGGFELQQNAALQRLSLYSYDAANAISINLSPATTFALNAWNHVALCFSPNANVLYLNGTAIGTDSTHTLLPPPNQSITLGRASWGSSGGFTGLVKQFVYTPVAWTAGQVASLHNGSVPASATVELRCNERSGARCKDSIGSHNGTFSGDLSRHGRIAAAPPNQATSGRILLS
jgi:hypothetical protein